MKNVLISISGRSNSGPVISLELAKALSRNHYNVYAIVARDTLNKIDWEQLSDLKDIYYLKTYTSFQNVIICSIKFLLTDCYKLKEYFKGLEFDYVFKPVFHIWSDRIIGLVRHKRVITICHDPIMHSGEKQIKKILYKKHIKNSDDVIVLTKSFIPVVSMRYGIPTKNIHYMPHGRMNVYREKQVGHNSSIYNSKDINYLFFGRIEKYKGVDILLKAFRRLRDEYCDVTLTIAGKGDFRDYLAISQNIPGLRVENDYIPDEQVGLLFDAPNVVVVLPYLDASQSGVIPIAIEYGTPIIASNVGGLKEQLANGDVGMFFEPGNVDDLYSKMKNFIDDGSLFEKQKEKMKMIIDSLDWDRIIVGIMQEIDDSQML